MLRVIVVALVLLVAAMFWLRPSAVPPPPEAATLLPEARPLPAVRLTDQRGEPFDWSAIEGEYAWLFFGFTNCPDICPLTLQSLAAARAALLERDAAPPRTVFVSVDSARDTPARIEAYLRGFDEGSIGVTGSDEALRPLLAALGVTVQKHAHGGESYNVVHSGTVFFVSPDAQLIAVASGPHEPQALARDFLRIRASRERAGPPRS
jgi:protein SCO1/2